MDASAASLPPIYHAPEGLPVPGRFQVLGERSSGTNYVSRVVKRHSGLKPDDALGWKHGVPGGLAMPKDLLVICVVRDAVSWARSMFDKPWHTRAPKPIQPPWAQSRGRVDASLDPARRLQPFEGRIDGPGRVAIAAEGGGGEHLAEVVAGPGSGQQQPEEGVLEGGSSPRRHST